MDPAIYERFLAGVAPDLTLLLGVVLPLLQVIGKVGVTWATWALLAEGTRYLRALRKKQ